MPRLLPVLFSSIVACGAPPAETSATAAAPAAKPAGEPAAKPAAAPAASVFEVATARITYRQQGPMNVQGTYTLWIEDHGARAALRQQVGPNGTNLSDSVTYWDGKKSYTRNGDKVMGMPIKPIDVEGSAIKRSSPAELAAVGWTQAGDATIAGRQCEKWKNDKLGALELCVWKGFDLQFKGGGMERVAAEIVEGEAIPAEIAALASG